MQRTERPQMTVRASKPVAPVLLRCMGVDCGSMIRITESSRPQRFRSHKLFIAWIVFAMFGLMVSAAQAQYIRGPRGGCYTITKSGNKRYVDRSLCNGKSNEPVAPTANSTRAHKYITGPRGGCYYITPSGGKQYVDRSMCK